jgi:DNA-binding MarR family transcriptional regulator
MNRLIPQDDWTRFATAVFALNGLLVSAGESIVAPVGQSSARWQVLGRAFNPTTVADMARDLGHARQSVQRITDDLVADGLVVYQPHDEDRRTKLASLTIQGEAVLEDIYARQLAWSRDIVAKIGAPRLKAATEALIHISRDLRAASLETEMEKLQ